MLYLTSFRARPDVGNAVLQDFITGPNVAILNENALSNIFVDVDFLEAEFKRIGREHVNVAFAELRQVPIALRHSC